MQHKIFNLQLFLIIITAIGCNKNKEEIPPPCISPNMTSIVGEWNVNYEEYSTLFNNGNVPTLNQSGTLTLDDNAIGELVLNGTTTAVSVSHFEEFQKLSLYQLGGDGQVQSFESRLYDIQEWTYQKMVLTQSSTFTTISNQEEIITYVLSLEKDPQMPCGEQLDIDKDLSPFDGKWDVLYITEGTKEDSLLFSNSSSHDAIFNSDGTGFYTTSASTQDVLFTYHRRRDQFELHQFTEDTTTPSNNSTDLYSVIELSEDRIVLQKADPLFPEGTLTTTLDMIRR